MEGNQNIFFNYLSSFFNKEEKSLFTTYLNNYDYYNSDLEEWNKSETLFKSLLPFGNLNNFNIEINKNASIFINQLFSKYVDNNTFLLGILEQPTIVDNVNKVQNKFILTADIINSFNINKIIQEYKNSNCNKLFIYAAGIIDAGIVPQEFYNELNKKLIEENIKYTFVLDDVQGMFLVPRDYSIFDYIIFTCHSLIPYYGSGILLSKTKENMGYQDSKILNNFINILQHTFIKHKNNFYIYKFMMEQYFIKEIQYKDLFTIPNNLPWNTFILNIKNEFIKNILNKYKDELFKYNIEIYDKAIIIKSTFLLSLDYNIIIEGLEKLKQILQKCIKLKDRL